jgi:hypothetical protein
VTKNSRYDRRMPVVALPAVILHVVKQQARYRAAMRLVTLRDACRREEKRR